MAARPALSMEGHDMRIKVRLPGVVSLCVISTLACGGSSGPGPVGGANGQQTALGSDAAVVVANPDAGAWNSLGTNDAGAIAPNSAYYARIALAGGTPYAIFSDYSSSSSGKLTVMKLSSAGKWANVGIAGFTTESSEYYSLTFDGTTPYVAYTGSSSDGISVMKFDGSAWVLLGTANFATTNGYAVPNLVVANGIVYVAFLDSSSQLRVMSFGGAAWVDLGGAPVSTYAYYCAMTIFNGAIYLAYNDQNTDLLTLVTWTGTTWAVVATSTYTISEYWDPVLTVSKNTLYLIYYSSYYNSTTSTYCGAIVWQLSGNTLVSVGPLCSISNGDDIEYVSGTVFNGVPYVAFDDEDRDSDPEPRAATVKYFDGTAWQLYAGYPSPNDIENTYLVADQDSGKLYLTYEDWDNGGMIVQVH
jgi:hypothetical protein